MCGPGDRRPERFITQLAVHWDTFGTFLDGCVFVRLWRKPYLHSSSRERVVAARTLPSIASYGGRKSVGSLPVAA
jgi:hypothetical protein